ncbi:MAG: hypothetical protein CVU06_03385 [Bacteroidetes bacterium HGW-Bacteroidetes-22]|nr:MAG: hypothetical protein CVU06_03385 [Bacteroidetes bacterium HGW-Bacteroidetes-22]
MCKSRYIKMMNDLRVVLYPINSVDNHVYKYAVICAFEAEKLLLVRTNGRSTWEIPGGHREPGEIIDDSAVRELKEETGAVRFELKAFADYSVMLNGTITYGRLFTAQVYERIAPDEFETDEVRLFDDLPDNLTYPDIQPVFLESIRKHGDVFCLEV